MFLAMVVIQNTLQQKNNTSRSLENKIIEYKQISEELRQAQANKNPAEAGSEEPVELQ